MNKAPFIKDHRVSEIDVNGRTVWIVRFTSRLFLKEAFDSLAELQVALGDDQRASKTVAILPNGERPWTVVEFLLKKERLYAVCNCSDDKVGDKGAFNRWEAEHAAESLNQQPPQP
ncbi:MAG: hypothetical protein EOR72_13855 [Mesorhizobium sp.]|uniref:hypothetical protein n=1 Tax=Mesorhizobium sp. TaxID=1871066 RepID=UPI000FE69B97|nr:hypothetical protein [Mesorhizobium sp.]RWM14959.1 MAG: hypothetical protein EOR72_13855 [Mesorhizobium sp.]